MTYNQLRFYISRDTKQHQLTLHIVVTWSVQLFDGSRNGVWYEGSTSFQLAWKPYKVARKVCLMKHCGKTRAETGPQQAVNTCQFDEQVIHINIKYTSCFLVDNKDCRPWQRISIFINKIVKRKVYNIRKCRNNNGSAALLAVTWQITNPQMTPTIAQSWYCLSAGLLFKYHKFS